MPTATERAFPAGEGLGGRRGPRPAEGVRRVVLRASNAARPPEGVPQRPVRHLRSSLRPPDRARLPEHDPIGPACPSHRLIEGEHVQPERLPGGTVKFHLVALPRILLMQEHPDAIVRQDVAIRAVERSQRGYPCGGAHKESRERAIPEAEPAPCGPHRGDDGTEFLRVRRRSTARTGCTGVDPITAAPPFCDGPQGITDHVMGIATEGSLKLRAQHRRHRPNGRTSVRDDGLRASPAILSLVRDQHLPEQRLVSEELAEGQRTTRDASGDAQHIPPEPPVRRNGPVFTLGREALFVQRLQRIGRRFSGKRPRGPPARTLRPWEASELGGERKLLPLVFTTSQPVRTLLRVGTRSRRPTRWSLGPPPGRQRCKCLIVA